MIIKNTEKKGETIRMPKKTFTKPTMRKGKVQVSTIICKKAACSGGSTHSVTIYKCAQEVRAKKVS